MTRKAAQVTYTKSDIIELNHLANGSAGDRIALRATMVLRCIKGEPIKTIAQELNERPNTVIMWRDRFISHGCSSLYNRPRGSNGEGYGESFRLKLKRKIKEPPPEGYPRWTGALLAAELGVPASAVWRYLRNDNTSLNPQSKELYTLNLLLEVTPELKMQKKPNKKMDLEFIARITDENGTVIEKKIKLNKALPALEDFDLSTREGLIRDIDTMEKAMVKARDKVTEEIADEYIEKASKKNTQKK